MQPGTPDLEGLYPMWSNIIPPLHQFCKNHHDTVVKFEPIVATGVGWVFLDIPMPVPRPSITPLDLSVYHDDGHRCLASYAQSLAMVLISGILKRLFKIGIFEG